MWRPEMSKKEVVQVLSPFPSRRVTIERLFPSPAKGLGLERLIISATRPRGRNGTAAIKLPFTPLNGHLICLLTPGEALSFGTMDRLYSKSCSRFHDVMWQCDSISNQSHVEKGNVKAYPCDVTFAISIIDIHEDNLRFLVRTLRLAKELILVDTSCSIPGAFEPTLYISQGWSNVPSSPLEPWLLNTHPSLKDDLTTIPPPASARTGLRFNLTDVLRDSQSISITVGEDFDRAQSYRSTILDVSQAGALLHSLQHVVALIHGPQEQGKASLYLGLCEC